MAEIRNRVDKKKFVDFLSNLGIDVHFDTKARGNAGFCTGSRIDVSKNLSENNAKDVLLHEFAHYVHFKLEPNMAKTHGSLEKIFDTDEKLIVDEIENELFQITLIVFNGETTRRIKALKENLNEKIKTEREIIKKYYPSFQVGEKFKDFNRYIRFSSAKYLLKYDKVIVRGGWFTMDTTISVKTIEDDFPKMPEAFVAYIRMKSYERHRNRLNSRNARINKYLKQPTELFARFFQFYCSDVDGAKMLAPVAVQRFEKLFNEGYYPCLKDFMAICVEPLP